MTAGRELDALIAEKVMGWRFVGGFTTEPEMNSDRWATDPNGCEKYYSDVPHYSTDIAAAMEVVSVVASKTETKEFRLALLNGEWRAEFGMWDHSFVRAQTAALAICHAALQVLEHE